MSSGQDFVYAMRGATLHVGERARGARDSREVPRVTTRRVPADDASPPPPTLRDAVAMAKACKPGTAELEVLLLGTSAQALEDRLGPQLGLLVSSEHVLDVWVDLPSGERTRLTLRGPDEIARFVSSSELPPAPPAVIQKTRVCEPVLLRQYRARVNLKTEEPASERVAQDARAFAVSRGPCVSLREKRRRSYRHPTDAGWRVDVSEVTSRDRTWAEVEAECVDVAGVTDESLVAMLRALVVA